MYFIKKMEQPNANVPEGPKKSTTNFPKNPTTNFPEDSNDFYPDRLKFYLNHPRYIKDYYETFL